MPDLIEALSPLPAFQIQPDPPSPFLEALIEGLSKPDKAIPCRFLYDEAGSKLFDDICLLPEYYPTRTETALLRAHAAQMARRIGAGVRFIELGAGSGGKAEFVLDALHAQGLPPAAYVCLDISPVPLAATAEAIEQRYPGLPVTAVCGNYLGELDLPASQARDLCFFPGSTIGNFERPEARDFLAHWRQRLSPDAMMLIGVDLKKDIPTLERAYDDAQGVTAQFSLNVLARANRELGADFDTSRFHHRARYMEDPGHIEISLVSQEAQSVTVGDNLFHFAAGEAVHIENSHKYSVSEFAALSASAGFDVDTVWTDPRRWFSLHLLRARG
ncbi:L-histidine N(alpha)-methyltransferase [Novosphingobium terrae]|uniref:L-histidine N(alpha)-methyltransferase n=1 Tax=Novosphingobium terrae TaxID=2726189 RepID=UPI00198229E8|nr:L-histidine N(alpha)-methyltransferase [Novosphingobium terrae]